MNDNFVFVDERVRGVRWDAKYATWDNFTGKPVDGYHINRVVGTHALCDALEKARDVAADRGFGLLLWDGYRPQRATECFQRWATMPEDGETKQRHYPRIDRSEIFAKGYIHAHSGHSRGGAVDLTLFHLDTQELAPMGGGHDVMDSISHHAATQISHHEKANRQHLRTIMDASGFRAYEWEWWHYWLKSEPFPHTYFDFPVANE
jgi:D-alanyl-D-alanine dipeptidase